MRLRNFLFFVIILLYCVNISRAARISTLPQPGVKSLGNHLTDIDNNFRELYRLIFVGESGFTGISGNIITSGTISEARIDSSIARLAPVLAAIAAKQDINEHITDLADGSLTGSKIGSGIIASYITTGTLPDSVIPAAITRDAELTAGLATKQNASANLTTFSGITPSANIISLLTAADYPAVRALLDLEVDTDFLSPSTINTALGLKANSSDVTTALAGKMNIATGTPNGTKFLRDDMTWQTVISGSNYDSNTDGFIDDGFILSSITRDSELTSALNNYTTTSALTTLLAGKMGTASGTPDGTKFLRDDMTWQIVSAGGGDDWDVNNDSIVDIGYLPTTIVTDSELTTTLSGYPTSASLATTLNNYVLTSALTTTLGNYIQTGANASLGSITSSGGADGTRGVWFNSANTITPNTTTYPDGIYLGTTSLIGRYNGTDYDLLAAGGSGSVAVDSTVVTNPNFDSNGSIDMSISGSNISASVKNNVITTGNLTTDTLVTSSETVPNTDTAILTAAAINKLIDHKVNEKLSASGFTIVNLLNPLTSPTNVSNSSYTVSGDVYDVGTTPVVTVSLNSGTYESATVTGSTSPWTWSRLLTLISGNNTIDVRVTASDNDIINLPQAIVNYTPTDTTDPVVGVITPSSLTHDGTGVTLTASINSIVEANEDYRQWSLYDVADSAIEVGWTTFTGLSISGITIPADQHTYRLDVRCTDLAGNVGTASSLNIVYEAVGQTEYTVYITENTTSFNSIVYSEITAFAGVTDTSLKQVNPTVNYASDGTLEITTYDTGDYCNAIVRFPGLSNIPSTATIKSVTFGIYVVNGGGGAGVDVGLKRLLRDTTITQATWNVYSTGNSWTTGGGTGSGDVYATASASLLGLGLATQWHEVTQTSGGLVSDIQDIVAGTASNYGWNIIPSSSSQYNYAVTVSSNGYSGIRPYLKVVYEN